MRSDTAPGCAVLPVDLSPEHTTSAGKRASHAERFAMRLANANIEGMRAGLLFSWVKRRGDCRTTKKPPRHRPIVGFAGGSAGIAEARSSPVALRHRLSTALL